MKRQPNGWGGLLAVALEAQQVDPVDAVLFDVAVGALLDAARPWHLPVRQVGDEGDQDPMLSAKIRQPGLGYTKELSWVDLERW